MAETAAIVARIPAETLEWLGGEDNPAVAVLTRRHLLGEEDAPATAELWDRRNEYGPVAAILGRMLEDGSWDKPSQDYRKYVGTLWQVHFLGELHADGTDARIRTAAEHAFTRQMPDGSWSATNMRAGGSIPCLTANVGRALARLGHAEDDRVVGALEHVVALYREMGIVDCRQANGSQLNGYCHMLTPKLLLFMAEVPSALWPAGTGELRDACVASLRDKAVFRCLPVESREFNDLFWSMPSAERQGLRESFLAEHPQLTYKEKAGWMRFGFPLSYNSDALEALASLMAIGEAPHPEYRDAIELVRGSADSSMRWRLRNTFNGRMLADVETKGEPSKWLTLRALRVLEWADSAV